MSGAWLTSSAAAPATTGDANEVPSALGPYAMVMVRSGATSSGLWRPSVVGPRLEKFSIPGSAAVHCAASIAPTANAPCATTGSGTLESGTCSGPATAASELNSEISSCAVGPEIRRTPIEYGSCDATRVQHACSTGV